MTVRASVSSTRTLRTKGCNAYRVELFLGGPIDVAKQIIREHCWKQGLCVTITPTDYVYTGGEEKGYVVGLVNYPRFPVSPHGLQGKAINLALKLLQGTKQWSALVQTPKEAIFLTLHPEK